MQCFYAVYRRGSRSDTRFCFNSPHTGWWALPHSFCAARQIMNNSGNLKDKIHRTSMSLVQVKSEASSPPLLVWLWAMCGSHQNTRPQLWVRYVCEPHVFHMKSEASIGTHRVCPTQWGHLPSSKTVPAPPPFSGHVLGPKIGHGNFFFAWLCYLCYTIVPRFAFWIHQTGH